jgi:polygalacturonase
MPTLSLANSGLFLAACLLVTRITSADVPLPTIPNTSFTITDYGAVPDGATSSTDAIAKAIAACEKAGGGSVIVPAGKFFTGPIKLASNLDFHLNAGATLLMSNTFTDYPQDKNGGYSDEVTADNCHDLAITGDGTIDGQGNPWWVAFLKIKNKQPNAPRLGRRPHLVALNHCTRVLVKGVTLTNSPSFHLVPDRCQDVTIEQVKFKAPAKSPNTDALDPSGWNYLITGCTFDVGDDCIAIKASGKPAGDHLSCEDFLITDCTFNHGHGMSIGSQTSGGVRRLTVRDCTFNSTDTGIRLKSNRHVGGLVEDCTYENLKMTNVKTAIFITSYYPERDTPEKASDDPAQPITSTTPIWRNIHISHVTATGCKTAGKIIGLAEMPVSDVTMTDVHISAEHGMTIWNAKNISFVNSDIKADKGNVLEQQQTTNVKLN